MAHPELTFNISGEHLRWQDNAQCGDAPQWNELFFADEWARRRGLPAEVPAETQSYCTACPVRVECLDWALRNDEYGVWGGTTRQQREAMARPIVRAKCPACQGGSLFRAAERQVCGDCGASWMATKVHGQASVKVDVSGAQSPKPPRVRKPRRMRHAA